MMRRLMQPSMDLFGEPALMNVRGPRSSTTRLAGTSAHGVRNRRAALVSGRDDDYGYDGGELGQSDNLFEAKRLRHLDQKAALRCAKACALEAAYLAERPRLQHDALRYTRQQEEKKAARAAGEWGRVQWEVATSLDGECLECGSTDLQCVGHTATLFVNIAGTAELDRPVFFCNGCGLRCSAHAQSIGAFPSLLTAVPGKEVWLDEDLLMLYASLQHVSPETSELAFATSLAELAGDFLRMTGKQLHEVLGEALPEYAIHLRHVTDPAFLGCADHPLGDRLLGCCAACWRAGQLDENGRARLHSIYFDACMKLNHLGFSGRRINVARPVSHLLERIIPATLAEGMEGITGEATDARAGAKAFVDAVATLLKRSSGQAAAAEMAPSSACASDLTAAQVGPSPVLCAVSSDSNF